MNLDPTPISAILDFGGKIVDRLWPDPAQAAQAKLELVKMQQNGELAEMTAQTGINLEEAKNPNIFVAGWRPFCGWVGGSALAYSSIIEPIMRFVATMLGYAGAFPAINTDLTMQVLFGLLGLGVMRSYDKKQGTETLKVGK